MPYRPLPLKPTQGQPWRDFGDATYDNVAQFVTDLPALKTDVAAVAAQAAALTATKAPINSPTFTGTVSGVTKAHVGLGAVDNTADASKTFSASQITTGTVPAARMPPAVAAIRRRSAANELNPTATNWDTRPAGFALVLNVGAPPAPSDAAATDLLVPLGAVATTSGVTFTGITDGAPWPVPFVVAKMPTGGSATVTSGEGRLTTGATVGNWSSTDATAVRHQDQTVNLELVFTVRVVTSGATPSLVLRSDNANLDPMNGLSIPMSGSTLKVAQVTGWSYTDLGSTAASWTPGTAYRVRVSLQGGTIRVRQWAATATEPSTWGVTATTTQTATGSWGFVCGPGGTAAAYTAAFDDIVIG